MNDKRSMTVEDLTRIHEINEVAISPDGRWIAYVLKTPDRMSKSYKTNLYLITPDGGSPLQITHDGKSTSPAWSHDSMKLAFISRRQEKPQIYILPISQPGEAKPLTSHPNGATNPTWSPDDQTIAFMAGMTADEMRDEDDPEEKTPPGDELEGKHRKERRQKDEEDRYDPRSVEKIPYRTGTNYISDRHQQIYLLQVDAAGDEAKPRRLTSALTSYTQIRWMPDGESIITVRTINPDQDDPFRNRNVYRIDITTGNETALPDDGYSPYAALPSPDGQWLAVVRLDRDRTDMPARLVVRSLQTDELRDLTTAIDRSLYDFDWTPDGALLIASPTRGCVELLRIDPETGATTTLFSQPMTLCMSFSFDDAGNLAMQSTAPDRLEEVFYLPANGDAPQQLTHIHDDFANEVTFAETHEVTYKSEDDVEIQGWYLLPPGYEGTTPPPLALNIHGGPHVMWSPAARAIWHEWQCHAAAGYAVFFCNPRGSEGYGTTFVQGAHAGWGTVAMVDIMAGVDWMIANGHADGERMAITGGSYGGYMTTWIIGHTDRFKAAVPQRGVYNLTSFYGTSDVPYLISSEFDHEPWSEAGRKIYWEHSPLAYAHNVTTPTLIMHAEQDYRVPIEQAEQYFAWIRRATDTPVKFIRYPREGHELSRSGEPDHRIHRLHTMIDWFNAYCRQAGQDSSE